MSQLFLARARRATGIRGILSAFDACLPKSNKAFGVEMVGSNADERRKANAAAISVLESNPDPTLLTDQEKQALRGYTGRGGIGDSTNEYYTPKALASGVWDLLKSFGFSGGNVCEPSCATGVFNETKLENTIITGAEVDPTSSRINQLLHPDDTIHNMPFEALAKVTPDGTFDAVIGNAPFGARMNAFANQDDAYRDMKTNEQYFVMRSIDKVKPGGLVVLIVNTAIVSTKSLNKFRAKVARKAEFLGAHRIPSGTFGASGSDSVVTDVVVFRKHPEDLAERIENLQDSVLKDANVLWDTFISGNWFKEDGRKFVHGEVLEGAGQWGSDLVVIPGLPKAEAGQRLTAEQRIEKLNKIDGHNAAIAKKLSMKFDSRIDWDLLESAEPVTPTYTDGDRRMINGRWYEMELGQWLPVPVAESSGTLDAEKYGFSSITDLTDAMSDIRGAIRLPMNQLNNIYSNMRDKLPLEVQAAFQLANQVGPEHRERLVKGALIGSLLQAFNERRDRDYDDSTEVTELQQMCRHMFDTLGDSNNVRGLKGLTGDSAASYKFFAAAMDENGQFRNLLSGEVEKTKIYIHDHENAEHVIEMLTANIDGGITLDQFRDRYEGTWTSLSDDELLDKLAMLENVAIDHNGNLQLMDRACSGDITKNRARIMQGLANTMLSDAVRQNLSRQLDTIKRRRKWTKAERINFGMRDPYIPRNLVLEFLQSEGFADLKYVGVTHQENVDTGALEMVEVDDYTGPDGFYTGYYTQDGAQKTRKDDDGGTLGAQLEKYLNGLLVRSSDAKENSKYRDKIRALETRFQAFIRQHDSADELVERYNDMYNGHIPFEHSDAPIVFEGVSGEVVHKGYQCSGIRRAVEEGGGILGYGTGLGKTFTALGAAKYATQTKRARRVCVVVPKAVNENWINETVLFYGAGNLNDVMFVGFDLVRNDAGELTTTPIIGGDGKQKINPTSGNPMSNPVLRESSPEEITRKMHLIPHSNVSLVLMTKEQYARIPLKAQTLDDNAQEHLTAHQLKDHVAMVAKGYKQQAKKEAVLNKFSDAGTEKVQEYPYFEDMNFDIVIVDEAHNYRNSQDAGQISRGLVYVSAGQEAQVAADMRQKLQYVKRKNNGRGALLLTATPTPNSPLDIYNMLSHVMTTEEWLKLGIANQDDFIRAFGEVSEVMINRISGGVAYVEGLTGFKNLDALRSLFQKYVNKKNVDDVAEDVKVPKVVDQVAKVTLSADQSDAYNVLRLRARMISERASGADPRDNATDEEIALIDELEARYPDDQLFSVIRDMDRVCTDIELYQGAMSFVFSKDKAASAKKLMASLKPSKTKTISDRNESGDPVKVKVELKLNLQERTDSQGNYIAKINMEFEQDVLAALKKHGLSQRDITHPLSPKYAAMVERLKEGLAKGGKQLIFSEEKSQHKKLHRILCHHLGLEPTQIGILNGDTVAGVESAVNDENAKAARKAASDNAEAMDEDTIELEGIEAIASRYNSGEFKVLILNKKGEVGVNLHIGTSDIHHATLPWTRDSLTQRNGRGARVGAPQDEVTSHIYVNDGSFDVFRKETIDRKGAWQDELFHGEGARIDNGDAEPDFDVRAILASNVEEYRAQMAEQRRLAEEALKKEKAAEAAISLHNYIKAVKLMDRNIDAERDAEAKQQEHVSKLTADFERLTAEVDNARTAWKALSETNGADPAAVSMLRNRWRQANGKAEDQQKLLRAAEKRLAQVKSLIQSITRAKGQAKLMRTNVESAIEQGLLNVTMSDLDKGGDLAVTNGRIFRVGEYYSATYVSNYGRNRDEEQIVVRIVELNPDQTTCKAMAVFGYRKNSTYDMQLKMFGNRIEVNEDEITLRQRLESISYSEIQSVLDRNEFYRRLRDGHVNNHMEVLTRESDGFNMRSFSAMSSDEIDTIVYPDFADTKLREEMIQYALKVMTEQGVGASYGLGRKAKLVLGADWENVVASADPNAPTDEDIAKWLSERVADYEGRTGISYPEVLRRNQKAQAYSETLLKTIYRRRFSEDMPGTTGRQRYDQAVVAHVDAKIAELKEAMNAYLKQIEDRNSAAVAKALADDTDTIRNRLKNRPKRLPRSWSAYSADAWEELADALKGTPYESEPAYLVADLLSAGYTPHIGPSAENWAVLDDDIGRSIINLSEQASRYSGKLDNFLAGALAMAETVTPSTSASPDQLGEISFAKALLEKHGISCRRNTAFCSGKPAYSWIGLHDPKGYGATLQKTLAGKTNPNKAKLGAVWCGKDTNGMAEHWLIPADIDPAIVIEVFGL